ncbi:MAG: hypothetical protein JXR96_29440 [Deltaproteobacteria bacterium]|nr:hypothetical protein [Deltaproteobacteria bacterium]
MQIEELRRSRAEAWCSTSSIDFGTAMPGCATRWLIRVLFALAIAACSGSTDEPLAQVLLAARPLGTSEPLDDADFEPFALPARLAPDCFVPAAEIGELRGRRLVIPLEEGEPLMRAALLEDAGRPADRVPGEARSVTLAVAGAEQVLPGDRIDVLVAAQDPRSGEPVAATLVQDVEVERRLPEPEPDRQRLALLVSPAQGERLLRAGRTGGLHVLLRHPSDRRRIDPARAALADLLTPGRCERLHRQRMESIQAEEQP